MLAVRKPHEWGIALSDEAHCRTLVEHRGRITSSGTKRVLYVAYPMATVSDESCGGAEQMLFVLEREMAGRGHETTVAACTYSKVTGELLDTGAPATSFEQLAQRDAEHNTKVLRCIAERDFDLVHDEGGRFWADAAAVELPVLVTLNLPRSFYATELFEDVPENVFFNCVSRSQAASFSDVPRMLGVVQNGVAIDRFPFTREKDGYLVWLGRICEEKGLHIALDVAERAGMPLVVLGPSYLYARDRQYFDSEVAPRLASTPEFKFVGSPSFAEKVAYLRHARALLMPSLLPETSSLVCMEAMACGTPAIAFRRGALPEIVMDQTTGFIVDSVEEMAAAVQRVSELRPADCRAHMEANHSAAAMADEYESVYEAVSNGCPMPQALNSASALQAYGAGD